MCRSVEDINRTLRRVGLNPNRLVISKELDPWRIKPSEWNILGPNWNKVREIVRSGRKISPVVVVPLNNGYEVIDGLHRVEAAKMKGEKIIAYIIPRWVYSQIRNFGDGPISDWAHKMHSTPELIPW